MARKSLVTFDFPSAPTVGGATTWYVKPDGSNASGTWGISITGNAATATTATTANAAPWSGITSKPTTLSGYGVTDAEYRSPLGVPRNNLGDPTVREMALFDGQFTNKTELFDISNIFIETSTDNSTWTALSVSDTNKRRLVTGDYDSSLLSIPYGTPYFRIRLRSVSYVFLDALYAYWSSNGHSTRVQIFKKHDSGSWVQHTSSPNYVSSWPGHLHLPFPTIPFLAGGTVDVHWSEVYILFQPSWNASFSGNGINIYKMQLWGGYPAGKRNLYYTDEFGNAMFPAAVSGATAAVGTNTTQLATTAFVNAEIANDAVTLNTTQTVSGQKTFSAASTLFTGNAAFDMRVLASTLDTAAPSIQSFNTKPLYLNPQGNAVYIGSNIALHAGNYTTYAPSLTGTGASGTWGISVTGNAATLTNFTTTTTTTVGDENTTSAIGYVNSISLFGQSDGALYSHVYSSAWKHQIFGDYRTGQLAVRGKNSGTWQSWRTVLDSGNYDSYARTTVNSYFGSPGTEGTLDWNHVSNTKPGATGTLLLGTATNGMGGSVYYHPFNIEYSTKDGTGNVTQMAISYSSPANELYMRGRYNGTWSGWVRYLNSNNFNTYAPTLTGTGASGTWGISISGTAAAAPWSGITGKPTTLSGYGITDAAAATHNHGLTRHNLAAPTGLSTLTSSNFRTTLFGGTTSGYNLSVGRWEASPGPLAALGSYGTMMAWSGSDTHGFLALNYSTAGAVVGGGSGDNITWSKSLAFSDGTGASGTWGISISGNAATVSSITSSQVTTALGYTPQGALTLTTTGTSGAATLVGNTLNIPQYSSSGTVTSVGLSLPSIFSVSGSPVTGAGTLTATLATQTANQVFAGPTSGGAAAPAFRALVEADVPALAQSKITDLTTDLAAKAPLASPTFTGTPVLPDAATIGSGGPKVGYRNVPVNLSNAALTLSAEYDGECVYKDITTAYTYTVPDGLPNGTVLTIANMAASGNITISMSGSEVLRLAGTTTTGSRTVGPWGEATLHKVAGAWLCSGPGVT